MNVLQFNAVIVGNVLSQLKPFLQPPSVRLIVITHFDLSFQWILKTLLLNHVKDWYKLVPDNVLQCQEHLKY